MTKQTDFMSTTNFMLRLQYFFYYAFFAKIKTYKTI